MPFRPTRSFRVHAGSGVAWAIGLAVCGFGAGSGGFSLSVAHADPPGHAGAPGPTAQAPSPAASAVHCTLDDIVGRKGPPSIDPRLERFRKLLESPPLRDYPSYTLASTHALTFEPGAAPGTGGTAKGQLAGGQKFAVTFLGRLVEREGRARLRLQLEVWSGEGKLEMRTIFVVAEGGQPFSRVEPKGETLTLQLVTCQAG